MSRNPFAPYPTSRGAIKLLLYGEPGTLKTRRALTLPGPRYMVDLEKGADEYGDLAQPGDQYLACQSHSALADALDYLESLKPGAVGTLIVDPITVIWQSLQAGHAERASVRKKCAPEEVMFDQGVWSRLNRVHNDLVTRLLNAPFHVVMVCRGKELRDAKGEQIVGYSYEGHKSLEFLAKTVIQARRTGDLVVKDRTGTWSEGHRSPRLDLRELLARAGAGGTRLETASEAARRDAGSPAPPSSSATGRVAEAPPAEGSGTGDREWEADRVAFLGAVNGQLGPTASGWQAWCEEHTWTDPKGGATHGPGHPSRVGRAAREGLVRWLRGPGNREIVIEWLGRQDEQATGGAA
jgi:hypothetical protein